MILTIIDINDQSPVFDENGCGTEVQVSEGAEPGFAMCSVLAVDGDEAGTPAAEITYSIIGRGDDAGKLWRTLSLTSCIVF